MKLAEEVKDLIDSFNDEIEYTLHHPKRDNIGYSTSETGQTNHKAKHDEAIKHSEDHIRDLNNDLEQKQYRYNRYPSKDKQFKGGDASVWSMGTHIKALKTAISAQKKEHKRIKGVKI
jgi:hypothetical protein